MNTDKIPDIERWQSREVYAACLGLIDLTSLNATDTEAKIISIIEKVNSFPAAYPHYPQVAAMCLYPNFASVAKEYLQDRRVKIAVVAAHFPSAQGLLRIKREECQRAAADGAQELDVVLPLHHFLAGDYYACSHEISVMKRAAGDAQLKVILETGAIKEPELIHKAAMISMEAGADFIKTSTGKMEPAATPEAACIICEAIKKFYRLSNKMVGFKAAGGIATPEDAALYYAIVETILGKEWLNSRFFRIGASRLINNLLSILEKNETTYY